MELSKYIGEKIRYYRKKQKITQEQLGKRIDASKARISNYETGYRSPQQDDLFALAEALDISINDLFPPIKKGNNNDIMPLYSKLTEPRQAKVYNFAENQYKEQTVEQNNVYQLDEYHKEYLYGGASAGRGQYVYDEPVETVSVHTADIPNAPYDIMLKVVGDSMEPAFRDGEYIFVKRTEEIHNGAFGIFIINGESYLKKVYLEEDKLRLVSLNSNYDDLYFDENDDIKLVGRVVL